MIMIEKGMLNMNNLFDRLKPEHKAELEQQSKEFPFAIAAFFEEFKQKSYVMDLRYGTTVSLSSFLNLPDYNFVTIFNLFEP